MEKLRNSVELQSICMDDKENNKEDKADLSIT